MSTPEPTALGTVVRTRRGFLYLRADHNGFRKWLDITSQVWLEWKEILPFNPVVVHEGYTPPTPEPTGWGARVRDARGLRAVRTVSGDCGGRTWASEAGGRWEWGDLAQPVTVISDGVDW